MGKLTSQTESAKPLSKDKAKPTNCQCLTHEKTAKNQVNSPLSLDTIAQPVHAKGIPYLQHKAKNQYFSKELARNLTTLNSPLNKAYRRTLFDCGGMLIQEGQKLTSRYCNGRWCNTCNRIRTAKLIEGYRRSLEAFREPYFVTLTIPNVNAESLANSIQTMLTTIRLMIRTRRRVTPINGIRKLECTYNAEADNYHPHFHFIVDGEDNARWMQEEWLKRNPTAEKYAQDFRQANEGSLMETFKYTTKIVSKTKKGVSIYVRALDTIFQAMYKVRTFQSFGNVRMVNEDIDDVQAETYKIPYYESVVWQWEGSDWYSMLTGDPLTGYEPSARMMELVTEKMVV